MRRPAVTKNASPRRRLAAVVAGAVAVTAGTAEAQSRPPANDLRAFPQPAPGQVRRVIRLAPEQDEGALRVGIVIGRSLWVDCNRQVFSARVEERTAQGWGYPYYVVTAPPQTASTRMACPDNSRRRAFVRAADEPLLRYNSRLPLVIFVPADVQLRYRIWRAGPEQEPR